MERKQEVWVIGGDRRYAYAADFLRRQGRNVKTYAVPGMLSDAGSLEEALEQADTMLLPLFPVEGDNLRVGTETFPAALLPLVAPENAVVVAGTLPEELIAWYHDKGIHFEGYMDRESYQIANAAVTAEGAVAVAINEMDRTLFDARVLVIGYGRIGKFLVEKLRAMGAHVSVAARRSAQRAEIEARGMTAVTTGVYENGLERYEVIFNTVPCEVITKQQMKTVAKSCLMIELASGEGGFPLGSHVIHAQGLPGKTAPRTAGVILGKTVLECISLEGGVME